MSNELESAGDVLADVQQQFESLGVDSNEQDGRELASKCLLLPQKRFYLDVKQNSRGRFIKVAEVNSNTNRKSRILLSMSTAAQFCEILLSFSNFEPSFTPNTAANNNNPPSSSTNNANNPNTNNNNKSFNQDDRLKSERLQKGSRLYYIDLKENSRGRYLRCSLTSAYGPGPRSSVTIPEPNLLEFRSALLELLDEFGGDSTSGDEAMPASGNSHQVPASSQSREQYHGSSTKLHSSSSNASQQQQQQPQQQQQHQHQQQQQQQQPPTVSTTSTALNSNVMLPEARVLRCDKKRYYFDISQNDNGVFMKISEVRPTMRATLTIPEKSWLEFRDVLNECIEKMNELQDGQAAAE